MKSKKTVIASLVVLGFTATLLVFPLLGGPPTNPTNIDVSQLPNNESEETIAVNPTKPNNIVIVTNVVVPAAGMFAAVSFDGGSTWTRRIIGNNAEKRLRLGEGQRRHGFTLSESTRIRICIQEWERESS